MNQHSGNQENDPGNVPPAQSISSSASLQESNIAGHSATQAVQERNLNNPVIIKEKRSFKDYALEFLLVVAAVILGFTADSIRENWEDRQKEKKYMESLLVDLESDMDLCNRVGGSIYVQVLQIDTLEKLFFSDLGNSANVIECYRLSKPITSFYSEFFGERTITQLLSSGSMRLIKKQEVADSIMGYHSQIKFVETQKNVYTTTMMNFLQTRYDIFDVSVLRTQQDSTGALDYLKIDPAKCQLRTTDPAQVKKFIASLEGAKQVAAGYITYLDDLNKRAARLYNFLKGEYRIKKNSNTTQE